MTENYCLSEGSLERYVCQGLHPPNNQNTFQVSVSYIPDLFNLNQIFNGLSAPPPYRSPASNSISQNQYSLQVLATKPIEVVPIDSSKSHVKRYRAIISDGKHHFDFAMFLLFDNMFEDQEVPENNSIIKVMNPNETSTAKNDFRQNSIPMC